MSDQVVRGAVRRLRADPCSAEARAASLTARLRAGQLSPDRLLLAAFCRDEISWQLLGRPFIPCGPLTEDGYDFAVRFSFGNLPKIHWGEFCRGLRRWPETVDIALAAIAPVSGLAAGALEMEEKEKYGVLLRHHASTDPQALRRTIEAAIIEWATL